MNCCHWKFQIETCFCEVEENLIKERGKLSWSHMKNPLKEWNEDKFTTKESNTRNTCMGHHKGSQLWWKLQRSQANLYCPQTFPPCLQPWCVTIIQIVSKTSRDKNTVVEFEILSHTLTRHSWISLIEGTVPFPCFNVIQEITVWRVLNEGLTILFRCNFFSLGY